MTPIHPHNLKHIHDLAFEYQIREPKNKIR
jgi:hypothetical protein